MYTPTCERISYTIRLKASNNLNSEHRQFTANHDNLNNHANYNYMQLTPCISSVSLCSKHSARNYDISTLSLPKPNALTLSAQTRSFQNSQLQISAIHAISFCQGSVSVHIDKSCITIQTASTAISRDCPCIKQPSQTTSSFKSNMPVHD